MVPRGGI